MPRSSPKTRRQLVLVLGDQLDANSAALDDFDRQQDAIWMAEVSEEATHVTSHKVRIAMFLTAMRHFRDEMRQRGWTVLYRELDDPHGRGSLAEELKEAVRRERPGRVVVVEPGDYRVKQSLTEAATELGIELAILPDRHFLSSLDDFRRHAEGRKQLRMEFFYREMRRKTGVLVDGDQPVEGKWNYDDQNRQSLGRTGPEKLPLPPAFAPDATTRAVLRLVARRFASHPGRLDAFDWPVTPEQAQEALDDFITHRLPDYGRYQDAMWSDEPYLFHSLLSAALNLKLLDPRRAIEAAVEAFRTGAAPLNSVEGFVRQILGWREYVRGIYWRYMPKYLDRNWFDADLPLPAFYWSGNTEMACLRNVITQTLEYGYAHHIQRLMVTGLFALLLGVQPTEVHEWYLAVYVDAVEWVELPNTLGMSQYADGGLMASKPYVASGKYIQRMSNYCAECRFDPGKACGDDACPFTTLYWDFLHRHSRLLSGNPRMQLQLKNVQRKSAEELRQVRKCASSIRSRVS